VRPEMGAERKRRIQRYRGHGCYFGSFGKTN
jgi:hypothetical protein